LIQTETIAPHVVGAQQIDATNRGIEVVAVVAVYRQINRRAAPEIEHTTFLPRDYAGNNYAAALNSQLAVCVVTPGLRPSFVFIFL
jgi:hypothetical protein